MTAARLSDMLGTMGGIEPLFAAVASIPAGVWVVGVSGGADSVALWCMLRRFRPDVMPIACHLNHESRGSESDEDASFVADLARSDGCPLVSARLSELPAGAETNLEAKFRAARHVLFRQAVEKHAARGVLLAHHADDRAETALLRLLRGGEAWALDGLRAESIVDRLRIVRPMLSLRRTALETFLNEIGQSWRTDASNAMDAFARNRIRMFLAQRADLVTPILELADAAGVLRRWIETHTPTHPSTIDMELLADLPDLLARRSVRQWLRSHVVASPAIESIEGLIRMARDRAGPRALDITGTLRVKRKGRTLIVDT